MRTSVYPREHWSKLKPYLYIYIHRWNRFHQTREYFALFPFSHTFLDRINLRMGWMCAVQKRNVGSKEYRKRRIQNESKRDGQSIREKVYANFERKYQMSRYVSLIFPQKNMWECWIPISLHVRALYVTAVWITYAGGSFSSKAVEAGALYTGRRILAHVFALALIATLHLVDRQF